MKHPAGTSLIERTQIMSWLQDQMDAAKTAVEQGDVEQAADITAYALLEGPGTWEQNLRDLTNNTEGE